MASDVMCCLCGEGVDDGPVDPCAVIVVSAWRRPAEQQREQQFFAHAECLRAALHPGVRVVADVLDGP